MTTLSPLNRPVSCSHIYQPTSKTEITVGGVVVECWKEQQQAAHSTRLYFYITSDDYKKKHRLILVLFSNLSYVSSQIYLKDPGSHATGFSLMGFFEKFGILFSRVLFYVHTRVDTILPWRRSIQLSPPPCVRRGCKFLRGRDGETQGSVHTLHAKGLYPPPPYHHHHPTIPSLLYAVHRKLLLDVHP
jgi:hypothetical protein